MVIIVPMAVFIGTPEIQTAMEDSIAVIMGAIIIHEKDRGVSLSSDDRYLCAEYRII